MLLNKKVAWIIFIICGLFDAVFSYIAVVYFGLREAAPFSGFFVHRISPIFYFILIPFGIFLAYIVVRGGSWIGKKIEKSPLCTRDFFERLILTTIVIVYGIGNTFVNLLIFIRGISPLPFNYQILGMIALVLVIVNIFYEDYKIRKMK